MFAGIGLINANSVEAKQTVLKEGKSYSYDLDGDGTVGGYIKYDQVNHSRGIKSCIGAVEYTGNDQPEGVEDVQMDLSAPNGAVYSVTGQYMGTDINVLPSGIYIVNGHKIIRQ